MAMTRSKLSGAASIAALAAGVLYALIPFVRRMLMSQSMGSLGDWNQFSKASLPL